MKNHSKVGNQKGKPAFRTQATFRSRKNIALQKNHKKQIPGKWQWRKRGK